MTVFRKLRTIEYLSSYSHGGRFYTLLELAEFDARGHQTELDPDSGVVVLNRPS